VSTPASPRSRRHLRVALIFLLPNFLGFLLFTAGPVLVSLGLSFTSWDLLQPPRWIGLDNFIRLLGFRLSVEGWKANDPEFWKYLGNTLFLMLGLPLNSAASLGLALLLQGKLRFRSAYRFVLYLPSVVSGVAIYYLWRWIFNPDYGLLNTALAWIGVEGPAWLTSIFWSKPALILMGLWISAGGQAMVLYLAALSQVSPELYEAAEMDGAGKWARFRAITWPALAPVTFFILTMGMIGGLQGGFEAAYVMTGGGPFGATTTLGYQIYNLAYVHFQMGYAATLAWTLFLIVLGVTLLQWRFGSRETVS
jgi:multiple sugar transport system permease protein